MRTDDAGPSHARAAGSPPTTASRMLLAGPAAATIMKSRRGCRSRLMLTGTGFAQPMIGRLLIAAISGNRTVPIGVDVHQRVERQPPQQARRRIAEPVGRPRVRRLVNRQRQQHDGGARRDGRQMIQSAMQDVHQGIGSSVRKPSSYGQGCWFRQACLSALSRRREVREHRVGRSSRRPRDASSSRLARRTPATLPNAVSSCLAPARPDARRSSSSSERKSRFARALPMERHRKPVRLVADPLDEPQRRAVGAAARCLGPIAREQQLLLLGDADRHRAGRGRAPRAPRRPPSTAPCRRRSGSDPGTAAALEQRVDTAAARPRAWRRSHRLASAPRAIAAAPAGPTRDPELPILAPSASGRPRRRPSRRRSRVPWIVEMSKHSMRRGSAGRPSTARSVSSAS